MASFWEVVGGADKGGILVREGQSLKSSELPGRLSTGAVLGELERAGERLRYCLLKGTGPAEGWISLKVAGKDLVRHLVPPSKAFPAPTSRCFGKDGKMKMLYLHGGGVSKTATRCTTASLFRA
ncbi:unnamed protein product [Symbiodinium necroappetens]|uniref:Uncharacterized protein n=1 Tax=Symbiodinium necroappetens TaxID=1628268 RepID=A0A813CG51_9DINO|nr:unnamed protein product [Symbiodinium necroappetens]